VVVVLVLGVAACLSVRRRSGVRSALVTLVVVGSVAGVVVVLQSVANKLLTGDGAAAGALVKLEINDPRLTPSEVWEAWLFHVRYQIGRVTGYHLGGHLAAGSLLWVLAALPVLFRRTRALGVVLWAQAVAWVLVVALNGQVRWQNERYTMPALAWLLLAAAVGVSAALQERFLFAPRPRLLRGLSALCLFGAITLLAVMQAPRMRDQAWFFGRASRNISDQHVTVGKRIRRELPGARRVLVGDAGAIPFASDLPALDIIGLGGYPELPFARASRWGVAAAIELIERIPSDARPDVLAIYPGWWGDFPVWFGDPIGGVSVRGNVICGGPTKMIYHARWDPLDGGGAPAVPTLRGFQTVAQIDVGDVLSEEEHECKVEGAPGFVTMKLLPHPADPSRRLWDGGRVLPPGAALSFTVRRLASARPAELVLRLAPPQDAHLDLEVGGARLARLVVTPKDGWVELSAPIAARHLERDLTVTLRAGGAEVVLYHAWVLQPR
jgi:disulfide bond formation protein DsbB